MSFLQHLLNICNDDGISHETRINHIRERIKRRLMEKMNARIAELREELKGKGVDLDELERKLGAIRTDAIDENASDPRDE